MNTQRDVYILNFSDTLYTLQLDAYTVVLFLFGPLVIGHPDYTAAFSLQLRFLIQTTSHQRLPGLRGQWSGLDEEYSPLQPIASRKLQSLITR